jgi:hypothetical protein
MSIGWIHQQNCLGRRIRSVENNEDWKFVRHYFYRESNICPSIKQMQLLINKCHWRL